MANRKKIGKRVKQTLTPKQKKRRIILILAVVAAAILCGVAVASSVIRAPELPSFPGKGDGGSSLTEESGDAPHISGNRRDGVYTFLVFGTDQVGENTDTIMVVTYDIPNGSIKVVNIPRDTMVNVSWDVKKINSVYAVKGVSGLKGQVANVLGYEPDYYINVDLEAFRQVVDTIGGVYYDVPRTMDYEDPGQNLSIHISKGYQLLDGNQAIGVMRWRHNNTGGGYAEGDVGRIGTQQGFLKALFKQCLTIGNVTKVRQFAKIFNEYVDTDLTVGNLVWFGTKLLNLEEDDIEFATLPHTDTSAWSKTYHAYLSYVTVNVDETLELVNSGLNPYDAPVTRRDVQIVIVNSNGSLSVTSGTLLDSAASTAHQAPSSNTVTIEEPQTHTNTDPGTTDPGTTDPGTMDPGTMDPGTTDPGTTDPGTTDPGTTDPGTTDPGTTDPGTTDPGTTDPGTTDPGTTDPGTTEPTTPDPGTTDPGTDTEPGAGDDAATATE